MRKIDPVWQPGSPIVLRGVWHQRICWACAATVVIDTSDLIALYWQAGTPEKAPANRPTPRDQLENQIILVDRKWTDTDVLMLATPGAAHSVYLMWQTGTRNLRCLYVELQEPLRRTAIGFDTMDQLLDIVISSDRSHWHWKDEDEFAEAIAIGLYTPEEAQAIRAEGERVIERLQAGLPPFYNGWERWSAPTEWDIPALPDNWDDLA
jgi:hypothetical protein